MLQQCRLRNESCPGYLARLLSCAGVRETRRSAMIPFTLLPSPFRAPGCALPTLLGEAFAARCRVQTRGPVLRSPTHLAVAVQSLESFLRGCDAGIRFPAALRGRRRLIARRCSPDAMKATVIGLRKLRSRALARSCPEPSDWAQLSLAAVQVALHGSWVVAIAAIL
jgi:hypothetical protein